MKDEVEEITRHRVEKSGLRSDLWYPFADERDSAGQIRLDAKQALEVAAAQASFRDAMPPNKVKTALAPEPKVPVKRLVRRIGVGISEIRPAVTTIKPANSGPNSKRSTRQVVSDDDVDSAWS